MPTSKKQMNDRKAGEIMLNEVFKVVEQLNATAGPSIAAKGAKSGNMTFSPKIVVNEEDEKQYRCDVAIYTPESIEAGPDISMEFSGADVEQFKQALTTVFPALASLAQEGYLADTFTVGLITANGEETEVYAPEVLQPGMYSLQDVYEEDDEEDSIDGEQ
ncbi:MAG: hypothetical protein ACJ788_20930 [Ktedonobacteraceae bacterium]